jgi:hypothetical protein
MRILIAATLSFVICSSSCTKRPINRPESVVGLAPLNLKLVVLNELILQGYFKSEIDSLRNRYWKWDNYTHEPIPEILHFCKNVEIKEEHLNLIRTITFDGGNDIYHLLIPNWDGEDDQFDIEDISGLRRLKNLEEIVVISMVAVQDYSVLSELDNLRLVHWAQVLNNHETVNQLRQKGVAVE